MPLEVALLVVGGILGRQKGKANEFWGKKGLGGKCFTLLEETLSSQIVSHSWSEIPIRYQLRDATIGNLAKLKDV